MLFPNYKVATRDWKPASEGAAFALEVFVSTSDLSLGRAIKVVNLWHAHLARDFEQQHGRMPCHKTKHGQDARATQIKSTRA